MDNSIEIQAEQTKDKGFTLVELLIVIVILGILATVTVFAVRGITDQGQESACSADQKTLETAAEAYFAQYGSAANIAVGAGNEPASASWTAGASAEETLVAAGFLRSTSDNFTLAADGSLTYEAAECGPVGDPVA